ncbi:MAG: PhoH family protein [Candidatus Krumholzibacteriota bacterium]|nr:PhoH family protein [Candidatus Krumholzibacteriota bacterium]
MRKRDGKKRVISIAGLDPVKLLGVGDRNLRILEERFHDAIVVRGEEIILQGTASVLDEATSVVETLVRIAGSGRAVSESDVRAVVRGGEGTGTEGPPGKEVVFYSTKRRRGISPRSPRQGEYVDAVRDHDIVFAIGPAGTGKTYLAMAMALASLKRGEIDRIFISRPVVEAGESLGFLPGDLQEKIDPYLRPIFDAMNEMIGKERVQRLIESGVLEIAPLAYMRGRTLNNAFAILDEAQNTTVGQMKMFLTRLGANAKAVITGDITQIDLVDPARSGLVAVKEILDGVEGIAFISFGEEDVVRHRLVKAIIKAFSEMNARERAAATATPPGAGATDPTGSEREADAGTEETDG